MISRDTFLRIASLVGYFSFILGALGQAVFLSPVLKSRFPIIGGTILVCIPWLIVFTVTFHNQPFLPARAYRICLIFAMAFFATVVIGAEVLNYFGFMPADDSQYAGTAGRVLMHVGWLGLFYIVPRCIAARRYEHNT